MICSDPRVCVKYEKRGLIEFLDQTWSLVWLSDSSEFNGNGGLIVCPWDKIDMVITDSGLENPKREWIKDLGAKLVVVPV